MRSIEVTGKTIEEAKQLASEELGVPIENIEFEILEEPGKGFLGLAHSPAKVKATTSEPAPEEADMMAPDETVVPSVEEVVTPAPAPANITQTANETIELLKSIFKAMNVQAEPFVKHTNEEEIAIDITGPDVAILIGKQGQTLDALQYLMGITANRKSGHRVRLILDAEGYRKRHEDVLTARALEYAKQVKESGEEAVFDPMPARDRRTIHLALMNDPDVYTYSEGEGANRHLVISPRKEGQESPVENNE